MRTLTLPHARSWLSKNNLNLDQYNRLVWPYDANPGLYVITSNFSKNWPDVCRQSLDWLPVGQDRLLLTMQWEIYPPDRLVVFDAIRRGAGAIETLLVEPAHLFPSTKSVDTWYDDRTEADIRHESVAMWLMGLMLGWQWEGYAAVEGCSDVIGLGDGFLHFLSVDPQRMKQARSLAGPWQLPMQTTFPWVGKTLPSSTRH